jgi:hypothetical protein
MEPGDVDTGHRYVRVGNAAGPQRDIGIQSQQYPRPDGDDDLARGIGEKIGQDKLQRLAYRMAGVRRQALCADNGRLTRKQRR